MAPRRDYVKIAKKYARDVTKGKETAGELEIAACKRFLSDLKRKDLEFDEWHACDPCDFIEKLPHVEGEWDTPTLTLEPWQIFILVNVFGFRVEGRRRFNTVYIEVARKNGKSAFSSGVALYCLTCEGENGPQVKTAATTGDQARIVFNVCKQMVERTPAMVEHFSLDPLANAIVCHENAGSIKPINAKASTQDGLNPHLSIIDELHAHADRKLFDVLKSARGARKNPLSWYITTAGYNMAGVCYEQREFLRKVLTGALDADHYFGVVYTLDEADLENWLDERLWRKANPNYGVSVFPDEMQAYAKEAEQSPESEGEFKTKRLNVWLNAASAWMNANLWAQCEDASLRIEDFEGRECWTGGDLASKEDITARVQLFEDGDDLVFFPYFYLPEDLVKSKGDRAGAPYQAWVNAGYIKTTPGDMTDLSVVQADIERDCARFNLVPPILFDQWNAFGIADRLNNKGLPTELYPKNAKNYTDAANEIEARYKVRRLRCPPNPVMRWMASNAVVEIRVDGSKLPKKPDKNSPLKIDGLDALITAVSGYLKTAEARGSVYDNRGMRAV